MTKGRHIVYSDVFEKEDIAGKSIADILDKMMERFKKIKLEELESHKTFSKLTGDIIITIQE